MLPDTHVSFIIPVYNKALSLETTLKSLAQQEGDFEREYIFINDGSTDASLEILCDITRGWENTIILTQANQGPALATNRGIEGARFGLVKLFDSDDYLLPQGTKVLREALLQTKRDVIFGKVVSFTQRDFIPLLIKDKGGGPELIDNDPLTQALQGMAYNVAQGMLASCDVLRRVKGCDERVFVQDYSLLLRLCARGSLAQIPDVVALYADEDTKTHLSHNKEQEWHDLNAALYWFLQDHPELDASYFRLAVQKAIGRARRAPCSKRWQLLMRLASYWPFLSKKNCLEIIAHATKAFATVSVKRPFTL